MTTVPVEFHDRMLSLGLARVSEAAALASAKLVGHGDENGARLPVGQIHLDPGFQRRSPWLAGHCLAVGGGHSTCSSSIAGVSARVAIIQSCPIPRMANLH